MHTCIIRTPNEGQSWENFSLAV